MRIRFLAAIGLCAMALCATSYTSQAGAAPGPGRSAQAVLAATTRPAANHVVHPANWAGYAVSGGTYTSASATWTAPYAYNNGQTNSTSYTWVGIDGWANNSLLRIGIQQGWNATTHLAYHRAFWGLGARVTVAFNVSVGDSIYASLTRIASNRWSIYLVDLRSGQKIVKTVEYTGPRQSADFVHSDPGVGELARTTSVSFYNARVNGTSAFASLGTQAVDLTAGGEALARPSYYNEAHNAFTITDGPDRPAAPVDQVFQRHSDGSIWVSNGDGCQSAAVCAGWQELDNNPVTKSIKAGAGTVLQLHKDGSIWEWTGGSCLGNPLVCRNWAELDENPATTSISVGSGTVYQLHKDGSIWRSTGQPCTSPTACPGWTKLDNNPRTASISAGDGTVFQLHKDGSIWRSTGKPCTNGASCRGWIELDDNPAAVAIDAASFKLYQRHKDGSLWLWTGEPCASATSCPGWQELDNNQATVGMSGGAYFYQRHADGSIWQSTGQPCTSATSCPGWTEFDDNPGTAAIAAGLLTVYQLHKDGSVWQSTGVACIRASFCPGWTELDDNQATVQISVSNGSLAPA
jgi:Peptidase A4 family